MWWGFTPTVPALGRLKPKDCHEFEVSLRYIVSFSPAWAIQWYPILIKQRNQNGKVLACPLQDLGMLILEALIQESTGKGKADVAIRMLALDRGLNLRDCSAQC